MLSRFKKQGGLKVDRREATLRDPVMLKALAAGTSDGVAPNGYRFS